jgi:hypothetical protein
MPDYQVSKDLQRFFGSDTSCHMDSQAPAGVFIDHHHQLQNSAILGSVEHEVPRPDVVAMLRAQTDARSVIEP